MTDRVNAYLRHQQARWLRPDAYRWVRPDAARFLKPGTRVEDAFPALALKYSPNQPRVPAGNGRESGRWTDGSGGDDAQTRPRVIIDTTDLGGPDTGAIRDEIDALNLFSITPSERWTEGVQLAGDLPGIGENRVQIGHELDLVARRGKELECEFQYRRDTFICNSVGLMSCWRQAAERYAACLAGRPVPPLNF